MRISRVQLAGLAMVLVGATAKGAQAADVTISTSTTTPLVTSAPDGNSPGNVTVASGGTIAVQAGQAAVTVNSNNNVTNSGTLSSENDDNSHGIRIQGGFSGTVTNNGTISLLETYTMDDTDDDGDLDGDFAQGTNRIGIFLQGGGPAFTGNISHNGGAISIEGNNSAGIRLDGRLAGNLTSAGAMTVVGDNSQAIAINGGSSAGVSGDVNVRGEILVRGENATGVLVNGVIDGALRLGGGLSVSGYHGIARPTSSQVIERLDADDLLQSNAAVRIGYSIGEGVTVQGVGVEDDVDDDGDGVTEEAGDTNDDASADIRVFGAAPAIWIAPNPGSPENLVLGATPSGHGFNNRGSVAASGVYDGFDATAIRVEGAGGASVTLAGGLKNDGIISASAYEAAAYGIYIGADATALSIVNRRSLASRSVSETDESVYGVVIAAGATTSVLSNSGVMSAQLLGELGDATVILDQSNTLATINNSGTIQAQALATDDDITDDVIPVQTGSAIAIDVSASSIGVTLNQIADTVYTDDDTTDQDVNNRPEVLIIGAVRFGSGADTINLLDGNIVGDVSFGAGADVFNIDNGARFTGTLTDSDGALTLNVQDGFVGLAGGATNLTSAFFGADSELAVLLSPDASETSRIIASGSVTFAEGALISPVIPAGLPESGASVFVTALGGLVGASNVTRTVTGAGAPWLYNIAIEVADSDPNSLQAAYEIKTAEQLNFDANETTAFNPILTALRTDAVAGQAFANLTTEESFFDAYEDLLPNYSSAAAELAATAIQQGQSATTNRIATTRMRDVDHVSVWAQEIGYGVTRTPEDFGLEYRGYGFGLAVGIDGPLENGALFGLSTSFVTSEVEQPGRADGEIAASLGQFNAYYGDSMGPIDLDFVAGLGGGKMSSRRFVNIGPTYEAVAEADWWAYEGHATVRASAPNKLGDDFIVTPYAALTYVALAEQGYTETGGGDAIDLDVTDTLSQRLWADVGVRLAAEYNFRSGTIIAPFISAGYRANAIDEAAERDVRFVSGGTPFTLIDETNGTGGPLVGLGIDATNGYSTFSLAYEGEFGETLERHSLNAALRFRF